MSKKMNNQFLASRMMLPEHNKMLKEYCKEELEKEIYYPDFDEQLLEEFQNIINQSLVQGTEIMITVLVEKKYFKYQGIVKKADTTLRQIELYTNNSLKKIKTDNIVNVYQP